MFGRPGVDHHPDFTQHEEGSPVSAPIRDSLLVLDVPDATKADTIRIRLQESGYAPRELEPPYRADHGTTFADPDG